MRIENIKLFTLNRKQNKVQNADKKKACYSQTTSLNNYNSISFARKWSEHESWGAIYDPKTKSTSFKVFVFPDVQSVDVEILKNGEYRKHNLKNCGNGIFCSESPVTEAKDGDRYHYLIRYADGVQKAVKDPYSFKQPNIKGDSVIYDHSKYNWHDVEWFSGNKNRVSRLANPQNGLKSVDELKIYEINCASLTEEGGFDAAKKEIQKARKNGFNAIEIMPVENTYSFNWGYDGVDKFAVSEYLGGADKLKELIDYAHGIGINIIMDVVPNHIGPDGESLNETGPYLKGYNMFGGAFNFENQYSEYVRDYIVNATLNWIDNFHCDGVRLDMTKFMDSDIAMKQIAIETNYHKPEAFIIAEDAREQVETDGISFWPNHKKLHDERVISGLSTDEIGYDDETHNAIISNIMDTSIVRLGCDSEWDFSFYHNLHSCLFENTGLDKLEYSIYSSENRVKYLMSHDEIGNYEGTRLIPKLMTDTLTLNRYVNLDESDEKRIMDYANLKGVSHNEARRIVIIQKAQLLSEKLAIMLQTGELKTNQDIYNAGVDENSGITTEDVKRAFDESIAMQRAAIALTYAIPGPKMVFQGDERADLTPFRFFRQLSDSSEEKNLTIEKGYQAGISALKESKPNQIKYSKEAKSMMKKYLSLTKFLNRFNFPNGKINPNKTVSHPVSKVMGINIINDKDDEIFVVSNFSDTSYPNGNADKYYIEFPYGEWEEILNTDDEKYGGSGLLNKDIIKSTKDLSKLPIVLPANSTLYFKKIKHNK